MLIDIKWSCLYSWSLTSGYGMVLTRLKNLQCINSNPRLSTRTSISILSVLGCLVRRKMLSLPSQKSPWTDPNPLLYCFQSCWKDVRPILRRWIRVHPPPFVFMSQKTWNQRAVVWLSVLEYCGNEKRQRCKIQKKLTLSSGVPRKSSLGSLYTPEIL